MIGLATVVGQTTILRIPLLHNVFYDLLIPLVVFLGLRLRDARGLLLIVMLGLVMDLLSGGIFGLYLSTYFWIFFSVKGVSRYFDVDDTPFQSILVALCVLAQHLFFWASLAHPWQGAPLLAAQTIPILLQITLAAVTGPRILMFLRMLQTRFKTPLTRVRKEAEEFVIR